MMGTHRFVHTLDIFGTTEPALRFSADQIDSRHEATTATV
jgi:hypothetical protein